MGHAIDNEINDEENHADGEAGIRPVEGGKRIDATRGSARSPTQIKLNEIDDAIKAGRRLPIESPVDEVA